MAEDYGNYEPTKESEAYYRSIGAPSYFADLEARSRSLQRRGPGSMHRRTKPSTADLTEGESNAVRFITRRYDTTMNVRPEDLPPSIRKELVTLLGLGFFRIVNGRIIPGFVLREHKAKDSGLYEEKPASLRRLEE